MAQKRKDRRPRPPAGTRAISAQEPNSTSKTTYATDAPTKITAAQSNSVDRSLQEIATHLKESKGPKLADFLAFVVIIINVATLLIVYGQLKAGRDANKITLKSLEATQRALDESRREYLNSVTPYLSVQSVKLYVAGGAFHISYSVVNESDSPAIVTGYEMNLPIPGSSTPSLSMESVKSDWIAPHETRPRLETLLTLLPDPDMASKLLASVQSGSVQFSLVVKCKTIFGRSISFSYDLRYTGQANTPSIINVRVDGLPQRQ